MFLFLTFSVLGILFPAQSPCVKLCAGTGRGTESSGIDRWRPRGHKPGFVLCGGSSLAGCHLICLCLLPAAPPPGTFKARNAATCSPEQPDAGAVVALGFFLPKAICSLSRAGHCLGGAESKRQGPALPAERCRLGPRELPPACSPVFTRTWNTLPGMQGRGPLLCAQQVACQDSNPNSSFHHLSMWRISGHASPHLVGSGDKRRVLSP